MDPELLLQIFHFLTCACLGITLFVPDVSWYWGLGVPPDKAALSLLLQWRSGWPPPILIPATIPRVASPLSMASGCQVVVPNVEAASPLHRGCLGSAGVSRALATSSEAISPAVIPVGRGTKKARQLFNHVEELPGHSPPPASRGELVMLDIETLSLAVTTPSHRPVRLFLCGQNT